MKHFLLAAVSVTFIFFMNMNKYSIQNEVSAREIQQQSVQDINEIDREKMVAKEIEYNNNYYKDRIWGNSFNGLAMSIAAEKEKYWIGEEIRVLALIKNFSNEEFVLPRINDSAKDFRYALYFPDGTPVPKSEFAEKFEQSLRQPLSVKMS